MNRPASRRGFLRTTGLAVVAGLAGCATGSGDSTEETTSTTSATTTTTTEVPETTTTTTAAEPAGPTVEMRTDNKGSYFDPKGLLVEPGTTVTFVNESGAHATAAYHPDNDDQPLRIPEGASAWSSKTFSETGAEFEVTFDTSGVYDYYCSPHEVLGMVGRIVVGEPQGGPGTTPPKDIPPAARETMPNIEDIVANGEVSGP